MTANQCPACGSASLDSLEGIPNPTCADCGLVISDDVEVPTEPEHDDESTQTPDAWPDFVSVTNETEKQTARGLNHVARLSDELSLSEDALSAATDVFAEAAVASLADGRSWQLIAAVSVCMGARDVCDPRPTGRIAEAVSVDTSKLRQTIRIFQRELDREYTGSPPVDYISYLAIDQNLSPETSTAAEALAEEYADSFRLAGKNPVGVAAAAVYEAANGSRTQRELADAAGITQETIRVRLAEVREVARTPL
jgi:transcription initiation factor TFIIB